MKNKGCLLVFLLAGAFCALLVVGFLGLKTRSLSLNASRVQSPPANFHVSVERSNDSIQMQEGGSINFPQVVSYQERSPIHFLIVPFFIFGMLAGIIFIVFWFRKPRSACAQPERNEPDTTDELQQLYGNIKRMEQRLQTLETILTDKCSSKE